MNNRSDFIAGAIEAGPIHSPGSVEPVEILHSSPLVLVTFLYLALPAGLFLAGWFRLGIALPGIIALLVVTYLLFRTTQWLPISKPSLLFWVTILISGGWVFLSGIGHFVYANNDWLVRDAVLRDLVVESWPVLYQIDDSKILILRAPLGYYLPAAVIGKLTGLHMAHIMLSVWTVIGVVLAFLLIAKCFPDNKKIVIAIIVFVIFSGLDLIGTLFMHDKITIISHLEWWARYFQYSSHTTQLFWVPNHALPGWLGILLLLAYWNKPSLINWYPSVMCITVLWSPFATIGLFPFYIGYVFFHRRILVQRWSSFIVIALLALLFGLPIAYYLTFNIVQVPGTLSGSKDYFWFFYPPFVALEFGILAVLLSRFHNSMPFWIAVVILGVLPIIAYGPNNDLAMRASIPALVVLALVAAQALTSSAHSRVLRGVQIGIFLIVLAGAMTAVQEVARAIILPKWAPSISNNVLQAAQGGAHYQASLDSNYLLKHILRYNDPI